MNKFFSWLARFLEQRGMFPRVYYVRFLPKGEVGTGAIALIVSSSTPLTLEELRERNPEDFVQEGFYALHIATGETLTVKD